MPTGSEDVRQSAQTGSDQYTVKSDANDPQRTSTCKKTTLLSHQISLFLNTFPGMFEASRS
jgi:hypothetical protein